MLNNGFTTTNENIEDLDSWKLYPFFSCVFWNVRGIKINVFQKDFFTFSK